MKKFAKRLLVGLIGVMTLSSCLTLGQILTSTETPPTSNIPTSIPPGGTVDLQGNLNNNNYTHPITNDPSKVDNYYQPSTYRYQNDALGKEWDVATLRSTGNQKMLVVPVKFSDYTMDSDTAVTTNLNKAFFGASSDTGWESVSSFYNKSSFGKLTITGEVVTPIMMPFTTTELEAKVVDDNYWDPTHYVLEQVYNTLSAVKLTQYDQNADGYVDSVFLIYLAPHKESDVFWAYQYYWNRYSSTTKPVFSTYAWASYDFMYEFLPYTKTSSSAHTYIHESGHLLGLEDYYDYDNKTAPIGGKDMMDHNITDHNMYSKYVNNWAQPYVVVGNSDITLRPAESSGDFIIINNGWNGHAYDEYILIEFYTPTGLNFKDSAGGGYGGSLGFTTSGVRIFHVDSRLIVNYGSAGKKWTDQIVSATSTYYPDYATSNTPSRSVSASLKKLHLLDAAKRSETWYSKLALADNLALFKTGDKIEINNWQDYLFAYNTFNDGSPIGYSVEIGQMTTSGVTIKIRTA